MKDVVVRIAGIEMVNIKNVSYGKIELQGNQSAVDSEMKADILGIYGQNGSGKTAVIEILEFLKKLMSGNFLPPEIQDYITKGSNEAECKFSFWIKHQKEAFNCDYSFKIKHFEKSTYITKEKLSYKNCTGEDKKVNLEYRVENEEYLFTPQYRFNEFIQNDQARRIDVAVAKKLAMKECRSFFFSDEVIKLSETSAIPDLSKILMSLKDYAFKNIFIIKNIHCGVINLNLAMPFSFKQKNAEKDVFGDLAVSLMEPSVFPQKEFDLLTEIVSSINLVVKALIPDMALVIHNYGKQMTAEGDEGIRFEMLSQRNDQLIPLKYESEGIKKILSVLNLLIAVYNLPGICVAIDELDAGVYEYLLGELLEVLEKSGKGQLIFTSHNLRPLEMIHKSSLVFTTTNDKNRYIRFSNVKSNNNMRDVYLRSINLGGQSEEIYAATSDFEISRAFRKAGRLVND